ncbi:hypothetical protein ACWCPL_35475, partial [Streptomyces sp. NPDC001948]
DPRSRVPLPHEQTNERPSRQSHHQRLLLGPLTDGNARAALLTLVHVLAREGIVLPEVGPLQTTRYADDPAGAADLAVLIGVLNRRRH